MGRKKNSPIDLKKYLGIISIMAFLGILLNSITGLAVDKWVNGSIYLIMGVALMIAGGARLFFHYFKDGLTTNEISKILTILIGLVSFISGLSIILEWDNPIVVGTRGIIALLAIIIIGADLFGGKKR